MPDFCSVNSYIIRNLCFNHSFRFRLVSASFLPLKAVTIHEGALAESQIKIVACVYFAAYVTNCGY